MNVVKAIPPLTVEEEDLRRFAAALDDVLARAAPLFGATARLGFTLGRRALSGRRAGRHNGTERVARRAWQDAPS
jgi:hypothetical protein